MSGVLHGYKEPIWRPIEKAIKESFRNGMAQGRLKAADDLKLADHLIDSQHELEIVEYEGVIAIECLCGKTLYAEDTGGR
jgi:hypothetical protein